MESNNINDYKLLLDNFISFYQKIQDIFSINLNDAFKKNNYNKIITSKFIKDTEEIFTHYSYDINKIINLKLFSENISNENLFIKYTLEYEDIIKNNLIINNEEENESLGEKEKISKKNHEVKKLSSFIKKSQSISHPEILFEIGCGKSYLTDALLSCDINNLIYIGVDMNKKVIDKAKEIYSKYKNVYLLNSFINFDNFNEFYENNIKNILIENNKLNKNIFLFGLHSCGNLTSNTLKIFIKNNYFKSIAIVGCCLNLLQEYINPELKSSKEFKDFYNGIGYDKKGNFLDNTLIYEIKNNENNIGYPISEYIQNKYKNLFFGKNVRNAAMMNSIENAPFESVSTQKNFFRSLLQKFLEDNLEEYGNIYGLGKKNYVDDWTFQEYIKNYLIQIQNKEKDGKILKKIEQLVKNINNVGKEFYENYKFLNLKHYALNLIKIKFAKIVEYIVALDRIIFLLEQGINNVKLIRIFNNHVSPRNLLIYATKD